MADVDVTFSPAGYDPIPEDKISSKFAVLDSDFSIALIWILHFYLFICSLLFVWQTYLITGLTRS